MPERHQCTKDDPWTPEKGDWAAHPDAESLGDVDFGAGETCAKWRCPHCGRVFFEELAQ